MDRLKIEYVSIDELKLYKKNAKLHPAEQIQQIKESIQAFGMNDPIAVWKKGEIIEGHGRYMACKELGFEKVPVIRLDGLTDEQRKAYMLVHNKLTMNTDFDLDLLNNELDGIVSFDMSKFGFEEEAEPEEEPEPHEDGYDLDLATPAAVVQAGDIWQLGRHRLMCGDSTKEEDVEKLMAGEKARVCVTDPPYNVDIKSRNGKELKIKNDNMLEEQFVNFLTKAFENMAKCLVPGGGFYIWYAARNAKLFLDALQEAGLEQRQQIVWVKNHFSIGRNDYHWMHEPCLYGWTPGAAHYFTEDRTKTTLIDDGKLDVSKMKKEEMQELLQRLLDEAKTTVERAQKPEKAELHPTAKPVAMIARQIQNSSRPGEPVLDLFGGSGTTLIACEQTNRTCYMMELDTHYCDVIIDRFEQATGQKAKKIN